MSDQGPAWDGRGHDPWLPDRVAALLQAAAAEARMFREFWDAEVTEDSPFDPQNERIRLDG